MVVVPGVRLLIHDQLETLLDWHLTDLVRYVSGHSLTSLALFFVENIAILSMGHWIQCQEAKTLGLDAQERLVELRRSGFLEEAPDFLVLIGPVVVVLLPRRHILAADKVS